MSGVPAPAIPLDDLAAALEREFGLEVREPRALDGEHDRNLRFRDAAGALHVAKWSAASMADAVAWQEALLRHVEDAPLDFAVPRLRPTRAGERSARIPTAEGDAIVRVLSWVDGALLAEAPPPGEPLLRSIGRASARLTLALADLRTELSPPRHHWLVEDSLASFDAAAAAIDDRLEPAMRARLGAVRAAFAEIAPSIPELPRGVVHQDLHDENLLIAEPAHDRVAGVIDFNDAFDTALVADLAVAGAYGMLRQDDPLAALARIARGYEELRPLGAGERRALPRMAAMRLAINWATWAQRGAAEGAEYAAGRTRFTRPALELLVDPALADGGLGAAFRRFEDELGG